VRAGIERAGGTAMPVVADITRFRRRGLDHRRYLGCYWRGSHGLKGKIMKQGERADYGIDAPSVIRNLAVSGVVCLLIALASPTLR